MISRAEPSHIGSRPRLVPVPILDPSSACLPSIASEQSRGRKNRCGKRWEMPGNRGKRREKSPIQTEKTALPNRLFPPLLSCARFSQIGSKLRLAMLPCRKRTAVRPGSHASFLDFMGFMGSLLAAFSLGLLVRPTQLSHTFSPCQIRNLQTTNAILLGETSTM